MPHTQENGYIEKTLENNRHRCAYSETETLIHCRWEFKMVQLHWETVWQFFEKLNTHLL